METGHQNLFMNLVIHRMVRDKQTPAIWKIHYNDVIMGTIASRITSLRIVYSTVYSDAEQRKYQSSASLAFVWGIHRAPMNSSHKWPVTGKMIWWRHHVCFNHGVIRNSMALLHHSTSVIRVKLTDKQFRKRLVNFVLTIWCYDLVLIYNSHAVQNLFFLTNNQLFRGWWRSDSP